MTRPLDDYEAECLEAFLILSTEARKIERRGWDSEQDYQRKVRHLDRILGLLNVYRALRDELETLVGEVRASWAEDHAIRRARWILSGEALGRWRVWSVDGSGVVEGLDVAEYVVPRDEL